eukprot:7642627-Alexandrium_andersonii.AAC.1
MCTSANSPPNAHQRCTPSRAASSGVKQSLALVTRRLRPFGTPWIAPPARAGGAIREVRAPG